MCACTQGSFTAWQLAVAAAVPSAVALSLAMCLAFLLWHARRVQGHHSDNAIDPEGAAVVAG